MKGYGEFLYLYMYTRILQYTKLWRQKQIENGGGGLDSRNFDN